MAENNDIISPGAPIFYFIVITIIYIIFKISLITSAKLPTEIEKKENITYLGVYSILILIGNCIINTNIVKNNCHTGQVNWFTVFYVTFIPWIFVFGILYILLIAFDEWLKPFSNTIGYFIVKLLGAKEIFNDVINDSDNIDKNDSNKLLQQALINMRQNRMKMINEMSSDQIEFIKFIKQLHGAGLIKDIFIKNDELNFESDDKEKNQLLELFKLVNVKDEIGKLVWYILAGLLITTIAYNHILNVECKKSIEEINKEYEEQVEKTE
jgi:hypothetical protein|tara:strand:- start:1967 stop:2770 length:804 start_codon:yes stop_codon:yes gene_type:complete